MFMMFVEIWIVCGLAACLGTIVDSWHLEETVFPMTLGEELAVMGVVVAGGMITLGCFLIYVWDTYIDGGYEEDE